MFWIKKLLFASILGTSVIAPSVTLTRPQEVIETLELEATLKKWNRLFEKISGTTEMEKLSKIFAKNLTTFSKTAIVNAVKQILMQWAIKIWENQDDFFPISQRLNKFFFYHHIYHWKAKNEVEELSWKLIKQFFIDFFFNEKGWFLLDQFSDFSSFVLTEWEEKEKPMKLYEWKIPYSNSGEKSDLSSKASKFYDPSILEKLKTRIPYLFPEIEDNREYSSLISKLTHKNEIELNLFKKKWVTISDLLTITDGYALGALIHMYTQQKTNSDTSSPQGANQISTLQLKKVRDVPASIDTSKNPLNVFISGSASGEEKCLSIDPSLFKEEKKRELRNSETCIYGIRWIEQENGGGGKKPKILVSREMEGISFYYLADNSTLKEENKNNKTIWQQEAEVIEKVTKFLTENFETIFAKFLISKKATNNGGENYQPFSISTMNNKGKTQTLDFSDFLNKNSSTIDAAINYLDALYWAEKIKMLQSVLLSVYKNVPKNIEIKRQNGGSSSKISLTKSSGLFSPLALKRSDSSEINSTLELPRGDEANSQKNEFFQDLLKLLPQKQKVKKISLKSAAEKLTQLITRQEVQQIFNSDSLRALFQQNPYFRAQLEAISEDKLKAIDTIFALKAEEILFPDKNLPEKQQKDLSELLKTFTSSIKNGESALADLINKSFFLEPFLKSDIEKKLLYGGEVSSEDSKITSKAKSDWVLDNFYFSDSAYESSSNNYKELLAFLVSIRWLTENDHANFSKLINYIFSKHKNKNAYLVWAQEITSEEKKELEAKGRQDSQPEQPEAKLKKLFNQVFSTELSNPLLKGELTIANASDRGDSGTSKKFTTKNSIYETESYKNRQPIAPESSLEKTKLSGFLGLVTESFSTREVPAALKNYIFGDFLKFNTTQNINYSAEGAEERAGNIENLGVVEGAFFSDNHRRKLENNDSLIELLEKAKKKANLLKYLDKEIPNSLLMALSEIENEELSELTLRELKEELTKGLQGGENAKVSDNQDNIQNSNIKNLYKHFNRFSGYIYSSKGEQQSPFIFAEKSNNSEERYYIGFVYQVNQFDFDKVGIQELKKNLSENTLNTLIVQLASNREISNWIYESEIIKNLVI